MPRTAKLHTHTRNHHTILSSRNKAEKKKKTKSVRQRVSDRKSEARADIEVITLTEGNLEYIPSPVIASKNIHTYIYIYANIYTHRYTFACVHKTP